MVAGGNRISTRDLDKGLSPKPILYFAGEKDAVLPLAESIKERARLVTLNKALPQAKPAGDAKVYAPEPGGAPVWWLQHEGGHAWPAKQNPTIVEFLKSVGG